MQVRKRDTSRIYALKTIRKAHIVNRNEITHTLAERLVLARVDSPFIVPLKFSFQSEQKLYLVLACVPPPAALPSPPPDVWLCQLRERRRALPSPPARA